MTRDVQTNGELEAFHRARGGLIFNDFTTSEPAAAENNRLHLASCPWMEKMLEHACLTNQAYEAGASDRNGLWSIQSPIGR